jgi:hypothetical protein
MRMVTITLFRNYYSETFPKTNEEGRLTEYTRAAPSQATVSCYTDDPIWMRDLT